MKGDFSRFTFHPRQRFSSVLMQQGRVQLDADWNEQSAILLHSLRTLAADLIGPFGAPANPDGTAGDGFRPILLYNKDGSPSKGDFALRPGRYYVDGIACENPSEWSFSANVGANAGQLPQAITNALTTYMLYLDVWERHVVYIQDEALREVALGGADTATRARVVAQVRAVTVGIDGKGLTSETTCQGVRRDWGSWVERWQSEHRGRLKAQARPGTPDDTDPCLSSPDARYRGENQLYRVEIHSDGIAAPGATGATFKWSSDNGSVVFPVLTMAHGGGTTTVTLEHLGRDDRSGLTPGDWVEIADGEEDLRDGIDPLLQVDTIDPDTLLVTLKGEPVSKLNQDIAKPKPLLLRRWDHRRGTGTAKPSATGFAVKEGTWLDLEDGVQIFFTPGDNGATETYRSGDYWLIPARVATGDVEWPGPATDPKALPPHGVEHHYAPLGLATLGGDAVTLKDCRTTFGCRAERLDTGVADWQVVDAPTGLRPAIVVPTNAAWGTIEGVRWISTNPTPAGADKTTYELVFNLCSCLHDPGISLTILAAKGTDVLLNAQKIGTSTGFTAPAPMDAIGPFQPGKNVLQVVVTNDGGPTGFALSGLVDTDGGSCC